MQAVTHQAEVSSLVLHSCGLGRKHDSCLVKVWALKQDCPAETRLILLPCAVQMSQVTESQLLLPFAKGSGPCRSAFFLLCSFSSSCPSFHFCTLPPYIFFLNIHFRNSSPGTKENIHDFSHQSSQHAPRTHFQGYYNTISAPFSSLPLWSFVICPEICLFLLGKGDIH